MGSSSHISYAEIISFSSLSIVTNNLFGWYLRIKQHHVKGISSLSSAPVNIFTCRSNPVPFFMSINF